MAQDILDVNVNANTKNFEAGMNRVQKATRRSTKSTRRQSQAFTQLAYAMDDLQYGFRGVQNNLQQIAITMGISGPLILAITAAIIAIGQLIKHFDSLW